jgi:hypothetical protein
MTIFFAPGRFACPQRLNAFTYPQWPIYAEFVKVALSIKLNKYEWADREAIFLREAQKGAWAVNAAIRNETAFLLECSRK